MKKKNDRPERCDVQVLINDCPVEFELQQDKKISDVINSISEWTRGRDLVFYELYIDDDYYPIDGVPDVSLADVKVINCIVQSKADIVFSSVDEATRYCDRVSVFMRRVAETGECGRNEIDDLLTGISWLMDVLARVTGLLGISYDRLKYRDFDLSHYVRSIETFRDSMAITGADVKGIAGAHRDVFTDIRHVFRMLLLSDEMRSLIVQSIDSPDVLILSIRQTRDELPGQLAGVQAAAVAYQMGKDAEGSERLKAFVDFIYRYTRTCYQLVPMFRMDLAEIQVDGISLEQKNHDLRNLLHEIIEVMENNDIISLSDILEYEIRPALENLGAYMELLMEQITSK
jgi:hypothetical protein